MERQPKKPILPIILRMIPPLVILMLMTVFVVRNGVTAIETLVDQFHDRIWLTTAAFMGLFLLKSVSFGLPFALLYIGVGSLYPFWLALVVNCVGIVVNMQIPYFLGRYTGSGLVERLLGKYPSLGRLEAFSKHSSLLFSFMVKFIGKIPHEITNALLGSLKVPYVPYVVGGVLGLLPTMVATTLAGSSLDNPASPQFILSVVFVLSLAGLSYGLYRKYR
jgi:uncharacterized membrane protein YdjX (TVP38/TMEM64 family)